MTGKGKKLLEEIHPLHVIREVQKWPVLYVRNSPERSNANFKNKIWTEIAKALLSNWDSLSTEDKRCKVSDLQRKWRNLRDTFKRQIEIEKKIREGVSIKKKTYVYFKYMLFLLPHIEAPEEEEQDQTVPPLLEDFLSRKRRAQPPAAARRRAGRPRGCDVASHSALPSSDLIDEDRHFLMSLIPSFKKMTDNEKLTAKMEILRVIKKVRSGSEQSTRASLVVDALLLDDHPSSFKEEVIHLETGGLGQSYDEFRCEESEENSE